MKEMNWRAFIDSRFRPLLERLLDDSLRDASLFHFDKQHPQQDGEIGAASFRQNVYQNIVENVTESV